MAFFLNFFICDGSLYFIYQGGSDVVNKNIYSEGFTRLTEKNCR